MEKYKFVELSPEREKVIRECFEEAFAINPAGLKENYFHHFRQVEINRDATAEEVRDKYISYVNTLLPFQNEKFTRKEHLIKNLYEFVYARLYKQEFKPPSKSNPKRDKYLYGI